MGKRPFNKLCMAAAVAVSKVTPLAVMYIKCQGTKVQFVRSNDYTTLTPSLAPLLTTGKSGWHYASALPMAATVKSMSSVLWARETNAASNCDGGQ